MIQVRETPAGHLLASCIKKWSHNLLRVLHFHMGPSIKVYHGFGTGKHMELFGHVLAMAPYPQRKFSTRFWKNTLSLLRLFMIQPMGGVTVVLQWKSQVVTAVTDDAGYFHLEWTPQGTVQEGWQEVEVRLARQPGIVGRGRLVVPPPTKYAIASDIDDTFLISYSGHMARRLQVLLTSNARTRRPFEGVVQHYQLLAKGTDGTEPRPFFYVSSSEWNLYDYIREFADTYGLPEGVYLLSAIKQLQEFWKTGQGKHKTKYIRIARLLITYPAQQFILLGDDSQEDPAIYRQLVTDFPGRIICVYLRHVSKARLAPTRIHEAAIKAAGVEICYFTHSHTAIEHSRRVGLIE